MAWLFDDGDDYERRKERSRQQQAEQSRKGRDIGPLPAVVNPERREAGRVDLRYWLETYQADKFPLEWSEDHLEAIRLIQETILQGGLYAYAMPRGNGKTTLVVAAAEWAACYGHRRYVVPIGATAPHAAAMLETIKTDFETREELLADFPEICYPVRKLEGINNRAAGQVLSGVRTRIKWTEKRIVLPTVMDRENRQQALASSGVIIQTAGLLGAMRGMQYTTADGVTHRPDYCILDDPQTDESARRPAQTATRLRVVTRSVLGLAGPTKKISAMCPCTVIQQGDLADQLLDRTANPEWRGHKTALLRSLPTDLTHWNKYRELRGDSLREHEDIRLATDYYAQNRLAMDAGCVPSWAQRFEPHQLSAVQYAMDIWAKDESAFWAEYQNQPLQEEETGIETLRAAELLERCNQRPRRTVPAWATKLTAFFDVQQDVLPWLVVAWADDLTGAVIDYGAYPEQSKRYWTLRDLTKTLRDVTQAATVEQALEMGLGQLADQLLATTWTQEDSGKQCKVDWLGIDGNWQLSTEMVYQVARARQRVYAHHGRFVGAASLPMEGWKREPGVRQGHFWRLLPGRKVQTDINSWKTIVAKRLRAEVGKMGSIEFFGDRPRVHELLVDQLSAEYGVQVEGRGRRVTEWKLRPGRDNHYWDCLVGCAVGASMVGGTIAGQAKATRKRKTWEEIQADRRRNG
jgi:hypothetical protein